MRMKEAIEKLKGNWKKFESFCWFDLPDDADNWCIVYTHHRDSPIKDLSNASYFHKKMNPFVDRTKDVIEFSANHWAVSHTDGWAVRVVDGNGAATSAFRRLVKLMDLRDNNVLLDPIDYRERMERAKFANIEFGARHCLPKGWLLKDNPPDGWIEQVEDLLHGIDPCWEDDHDEEGAPHPRAADLFAALTQANLLEVDE